MFFPSLCRLCSAWDTSRVHTSDSIRIFCRSNNWPGGDQLCPWVEATLDWRWSRSESGLSYFLEVLNRVVVGFETVMHHDEVKIEGLQQLKYVDCLRKGEARDGEGQLRELFLGKAQDFRFYVELLSMVEFFFFFFLHPVVDGADFCISLHDGYSHPMINFVVLGIFLSRHWLTILLLSTSFRGKSPPVRFSTSLSVTSDFLLKPIGFFEGTWGRYFHSSSLIYKNNIRRQRADSLKQPGISIGPIVLKEG